MPNGKTIIDVYRSEGRKFWPAIGRRVRDNVIGCKRGADQPYLSFTQHNLEHSSSICFGRRVSEQ